MNLETVMTRSHDVRSRFKRSWQHPIHLEIVMTRGPHVRSRFKGSEHQPD